MTYLILSLLFNFVFGFIGTAVLIFGTSGSDNEWHVAWGTLGYWILAALLAALTTGWSAVAASFVGGSCLFILAPNTLGSIAFTWARVILSVANGKLLRGTIIAKPMRWFACRLQDLQAYLSVGWRRRKP